MNLQAHSPRLPFVWFISMSCVCLFNINNVLFILTYVPACYEYKLRIMTYLLWNTSSPLPRIETPSTFETNAVLFFVKNATPGQDADACFVSYDISNYTLSSTITGNNTRTKRVMRLSYHAQPYENR